MLAISGSETPTVRVSSYELGEVIPSNLLNANEIPTDAADIIRVSQPAVFHRLRVVSVSISPVLRDYQGVLAQSAILSSRSKLTATQ